jgi:hypothetical protein
VVVFPIPTGAAPAYVELADGFVETLHGDRNEARVDIAPGDVTWQTPRGSDRATVGSLALGRQHQQRRGRVLGPVQPVQVGGAALEITTRWSPVASNGPFKSGGGT